MNVDRFYSRLTAILLSVIITASMTIVTKAEGETTRQTKAESGISAVDGTEATSPAAFEIMLADFAATAAITEDTGWYDPDPESEQTIFNISSASQLAGLAAIVSGDARNEEYEYFSDDFSGKTVNLTASVDLSGMDWMPIGNKSGNFYGTFDGQGHTITGLSVDTTVAGTSYTGSPAGLFGFISDEASLRNVVIDGATVKGVAAAGALVGWDIGGSIENCSATNVDISCVAGTVGQGASATAESGGLVGHISTTYGHVSDCYATGTVKGHHAGGIVGGPAQTTFSRCYFVGTVTAEAVSGVGGPPKAGGIAATCNLEILDCYSSGTVTSPSFAGGIVGDFMGSKISNCYSTASVTGSTAGGIAGNINTSYSNTEEIVNCAALNAGITAKRNNAYGLARVLPFTYDEAYSKPNKNTAWSDMPLTYIVGTAENTKTPLEEGHNRPDGFGVSAEEFLTEAFWTSSTDNRDAWGSPWFIEDGKLPGLGSAVKPPAHLTGGVELLEFADNAAYDIPESNIGVAIAEINISASISGGSMPYKFSAAGLPAGLSIDEATGIISGTPTATKAAGTATVSVTDAASILKSITIAYGAVADGPLVFADSDSYNIPAAIVGEAITSVDVSTGFSGGTPGYKYSAAGLPAGISINSASGVISGSPTDESAAGKAVVTATDQAGKTASIEIDYGAMTFAPFTFTDDDKYDIPASTIGIAINIDLSDAVSGGKKPYTFAVVGHLPMTLGISEQGLINGTLTAASEAGTAEISAVDAGGTEAKITINYGAVADNSLVFTDDEAYNIPEMKAGDPIAEINLYGAVSGGEKPYTFSHGGLPTGIGIDAETGIISGTPIIASEQPGIAPIYVTDAVNAKKSIEISFGAVNPEYDPLIFTDSENFDMPEMKVGTAIAEINVSDSVSGGKAPYTFRHGGLPKGLMIGETTGLISGTPAEAREIPGLAPIYVTDSLGEEKMIEIAFGRIEPEFAPLVFNDSPSYDITSLRVGSPIQNINLLGAVSGGKAPYTFRHEGLPVGLAIGTETGIISGIPAIANSVPGTLRLYVKDSLNNELYIEIAFAEVLPAVTNSGNSGGSNSGGGASRSPVRPTVPANEGETDVSYSLTNSGKAVDLSLTSNKIAEIIDNAADEKVEFNLSEVSSATNVSLPKSALTQLADAELGLKVEFPQGIIELDAGAAKSAAQATSATASDIALELEKVETSTLSEARQQALNPGDSLFSIRISSGMDDIREFDGIVTVTVPYDGPLPVAVWYLNDAGQREKMNSAYDEATEIVSFTTNHLSDYVVGFDAKAEAEESMPETMPVPATPEVPFNPFTDVTAASYIDDVIYVYEHGLMSGTNISTMTFSPDDGLTRGMFAAIIYRHAGSPDVSGLENTFSDIEDEYYADAVTWAARNNIVAGAYGKFSPHEIISRQDLAAILLRYIDYMKVNIVMTQEYILFTDDANISDYAKNAAQIMTKLGVIEKADNGEINPKGDVTRAQAATALHRFIKAIEK